MKDTLVIAAFPATGKSYAFKNYNNDYIILDSDSSKFSWIERKRTDEEIEEIRARYESEPHLMSWEGYYNQIKNDLIKTRNPKFPSNYIQHIKENIGKVDFIFVSTHKQVLKAMEEAGIPMVSAEVTMIPQNYVELTDETAVKNLNRILDLLDEDDDVQAVYHNWDE